MSHQTGFVNWRWLHKTKKLAFDSEPGTQFGYSGEGFEYLRKALEAKFKQPLQQLSNTLIFAPLGTQSTQYFWDGTTPTDRFAHWHDAEGKNAYQKFRTEKENAADDLLTTVEDYGRFAVHVMSGAGLSPQLFAEMISPHARIKQHDDMGLGWESITQLANNEYAMLHSGSDVGVKTLVVLLPKSKEGLVLFTNGDNGFDVIAELLPLYLSVGKELMARS